jgi:hypothetical protein
MWCFLLWCSMGTVASKAPKGLAVKLPCGAKGKSVRRMLGASGMPTTTLVYTFEI